MGNDEWKSEKSSSSSKASATDGTLFTAEGMCLDERGGDISAETSDDGSGLLVGGGGGKKAGVCARELARDELATLGGGGMIPDANIRDDVVNGAVCRAEGIGLASAGDDNTDDNDEWLFVRPVRCVDGLEAWL